MKIFWIILTLIFIILTLGIVDVEMNFTDGSFIRYRSWLRTIKKNK